MNEWTETIERQAKEIKKLRDALASIEETSRQEIARLDSMQSFSDIRAIFQDFINVSTEALKGECRRDRVLKENDEDTDLGGLGEWQDDPKGE